MLNPEKGNTWRAQSRRGLSDCNGPGRAAAKSVALLFVILWLFCEGVRESKYVFTIKCFNVLGNFLLFSLVHILSIEHCYGYGHETTCTFCFLRVVIGPGVSSVARCFGWCMS